MIIEVLLYGEIEIQRRLLKHNSDPRQRARDMMAHIRPEHFYRPASHMIERRGERKECRFSCPVQAKKNRKIPWLHLDVYVVKNLALTALDEEVHLEDVERVLAAHSGPVAAGEMPLDQPYREARDTFERLYFEYQLARESGSMSRVADRTGLERTHLYRKLKALGLPVGRREES